MLERDQRLAPLFDAVRKRFPETPNSTHPRRDYDYGDMIRYGPSGRLRVLAVLHDTRVHRCGRWPIGKGDLIWVRSSDIPAAAYPEDIYWRAHHRSSRGGPIGCQRPIGRMLNNMEREGLVESTWTKNSRHCTCYWSITDKGVDEYMRLLEAEQKRVERRRKRELPPEKRVGRAKKGLIEADDEIERAAKVRE